MLCALTTIVVILANSVSLPIRVALTTKRPLWFSDAPITALPIVTSTSADSPVSNELSTALLPETTIPSVAIRSPGRTSNSSPICRFSIEEISGNPPRIIVTSLAPSESNVDKALLARRFARVSRYLPRTTKRITPPATSV